MNKKVVYHSSNPNVASIKQNGKLTGISRGQSVITVMSEDSAQNGSSGPMTAKFTVTVTESIRSITLDRTSYSMGTGESVTLSARIMPYGSLN